MKTPLTTDSSNSRLKSLLVFFSDGQTRGAWATWLLLLSLAWSGGLSPVCSAADRLEESELYKTDHIVEVEIKMSEADWDSLRLQTRNIGKAFIGDSEDPFTWFRASIRIDQHEIPNVGIRKKGFIGSLDEHFPSLKIDLERFEDKNTKGGIDSLTLNNNKQDESLLSQYLSYKLFRKNGVHAPRCNLARVHVNGEYLGLYSNVESLGKPFLRRHFEKSGGNLFEGTLTDFHPKTISKLEAKTNKKEKDRARLESLAKLLQSSGDVDLESVGEIIDIDNFIKYWAIESLIGFWDGYSNNQNNYWFYEDPKSNRIFFMPWGADGAFGSMGGFGGDRNVSVYSQSILCNRLYHSPRIAEAYKNAMRELLRDSWDEKELIADVEAMEQLYADHLHARQKNAKPAASKLKDFIANRREKINDELDKWPVAIADSPRKPSYTVMVGKAEGTFKTSWREKPIASTELGANASLQLQIQSKASDFERSCAMVHPRPVMAFGFGPPPTPTPMIDFVVEGFKKGESSSSRLTIGIPTDLWDSLVQNPKDRQDGIDAEGVIIEQRPPSSPTRGFGMSSFPLVKGKIYFDSVGDQPGDEVSGRFQFDVLEIHGGFFNPPPERAIGAGSPGTTLRGSGGSQPMTPPGVPFQPSPVPPILKPVSP